MDSTWEASLYAELSQQNASGSVVTSWDSNDGASTAALGDYTNNIFGAPYQLLDSVDRRFGSINQYLGSAYLSNIMLNSPILYVRPGVPHYTGGDETGLSSIGTSFTDMVKGVQSGNMSIGESLAYNTAKTLFSSGSTLQRRMYGLKETYNDYMEYVNYMLRSVATYMGLTSGTSFPNYTFTGGGSKIEFADGNWQNYRMLASENVTDAFDQLKSIAGGFVSSAYSSAVSLVSVGLNAIDFLSGSLFSLSSVADALGATANDTTALDAISARTTTVQFMVEPVATEENYSNKVETSMVESMIDNLTNTVGYELAFIMNSNTDVGVLGDGAAALGDTISDAMSSVSSMMQGVSGGWVNNLFQGGLKAISGQKMIYPKIYKSSTSDMSYSYKMTLSSPYGDIYNVFMNIMVPLCHILGFTNPRMVSSNSITSPFLVQAFIPGMSTCELGIISNLSIKKNPSENHVSVNGFPLTVEVNFTVQELYNAMSISSGSDPASFLYNETLNDYLCNMGGLVPSTETRSMQQSMALSNSFTWITNIGNSLSDRAIETVSNLYGITY